jgi:NADPH-dependent 2,4-dienoyl-CoA reductase/sulfur reductase-like enzyme
VSVERLVVIGGDAGGLSAAAQARRLRPADELDIVVLEQGPEASYSACGIPYWVGGLVSDRDQLIARTPSQFAARTSTSGRARGPRRSTSPVAA